ncbi:MAG: serine/threonine-protein kinase PknG [Actinobacteria bacterium]|nr:serine/threonine-protein kinase PknG [Actinomycetota bacterium]
MRCGQPGCTGTIVDGYCDVCGMPPTPGTMPVGRGVPGSRPSTTATGPCPQPGCGGRIVDGYCDVCGLPPEPASSPGTAASSASSLTRASAQLGSTALGSARASSFGAPAVRRRPPRRSGPGRIGAGLTYVPPAPAIDPSKAVLVSPVVPEDRRVCPNCGVKVGQSSTVGSGRSEGFCPNCGAPYSFTAKLAAGDVVAGQYQVEGALAHGGMGWIYLARDLNVSGRWVVLKGLLNTGDSDALAATISEQQFLARVEHPLIVEIHNFVTHDDAGYIVMEYVGGRSLKQLLKQRMEANGGEPNPLPLDQALAFLIEILPAFSYLHELGLLYCDFKPDNVIQVGDALKLIDLGGVRHAGDDDSAIYGTVGFQAPEVATAGPSVASDIFTIGRTLMVLCADVPGYQTSYEFTIPPVDEIPVFAEHDAAYRLLLKCCARDPNDRFASADELRTQLIGVLREVVAARTQGVATTAAASALFDPPTATGDRFSWRQLPRLRPDEADPQRAWVARINIDDPAQRLAALGGAPAQTAEVLLARGHAALELGDARALDACVQQLLTADPWEWRAVWLAGLGSLAAQDYATAQSSFNAVYGQVPGELAPKLALAVACELGGEPDLAQTLYLVCASTDANYVTPAAFGLARVRAGRGDAAGTLTALELVPNTSRGYPESQRQRAVLLATQAHDIPAIDRALTAIGASRLEPVAQAEYEQLLLERALDLAGKGPVRLGGQDLDAAGLRGRLEQAYRNRAALTSDPAERAHYVDLALSIRPWSLL